MSKFKSLAFMAVMTVAALLALGNLTTPAQANHAGIAASTATPFTDPNGQGEPVPEEVKAVIQAYFELRYQALSVSDADSFKQNGFGDLIADTSDAKVFLQECSNHFCYIEDQTAGINNGNKSLYNAWRLAGSYSKAIFWCCFTSHGRFPGNSCNT